MDDKTLNNNDVFNANILVDSEILYEKACF